MSGWLLTLLLSLWPMTIPLNYLLNDSTLAEKALLSATYLRLRNFAYLSIPAGETLGFKSVFELSPSPLSGAMVVLSAAFSIIIQFTQVIVQSLGDLIPIAGFCFLIISPVIIVFGVSHFTNATTTFCSSEHIQK